MIMNNKQTYSFHISGMHCNSCVLMTESELGKQPEIKKVKTSLQSNSVEVTGDFGDKSQEQIASELNEVLKKHGYTLSVEKQIKTKNLGDFKIAVPVAIVFTILFFVLQKVGLINIIGSGKVTYGTAFVIGIIASLSTCMAVVGGLILSMSATFDKVTSSETSRRSWIVSPQMMFHVGRIVSFFILGGVIGAVGSAFTLSTIATFILGVIIAIVMFILGINLLDVFPWAKKLQLSMPKFLGKNALSVSKFNHTLTPLLVGVATFFLPCGFTQSMQIYTLGTGSFLKGGLSMLSFALGTLPVLALISFSSFSIQNNKNSGIFFKSAGLIVIMFALFNLINSLVVIGVIPPIFNF